MRTTLILGLVAALVGSPAAAQPTPEESRLQETLARSSADPLLDLAVADCRLSLARELTGGDAKSVQEVAVSLAQIDGIQGTFVGQEDGSALVSFGTNHDAPAVRVALRGAGADPNAQFLAALGFRVRSSAAAGELVATLRQAAQRCQPETYGELGGDAGTLAPTLERLLREATPTTSMFGTDVKQRDVVQVGVDRCSLFLQTFEYDAANPNDVWGRKTHRMYADLTGATHSLAWVRADGATYDVTVYLRAPSTATPAADAIQPVTESHRNGSGLRSGFKAYHEYVSLDATSERAGRQLAAGIQRLIDLCNAPSAVASK